MSEKTALALLGNPGAGKSTILNGVARRPVFKSGVSLGVGLTSKLAFHETPAYLLCDSPGLADISRSLEAAQQLDDLLAGSTSIKLGFVVILDRGSVRPQDAKTIDRVLSAVSGLNANDSFGIIINKVGPRVNDLICSQPGAFERLKEKLLGKRWTSHWLIVGHDQELEDKSNGMLMTPELEQFLDQLPITKPDHASAKRVRESAMPLKLNPRKWTWADAKVKIKVPENAQLCWAPFEWQRGWCRVYGPAAVVLELKWVWSDVELLATSSR